MPSHPEMERLPEASAAGAPNAPDVPRRGAGRGSAIRLFGAIGLSLYGDWLSTVALVVILFQMTGNAVGPAAYMLARVAPRPFAAWYGGRFQRPTPRDVLILTSTLQAVATGSLVLSHRAGFLAGVYIAVVCAQFLGGAARPSTATLIREVVEDSALPRANAISALLMSTSIFLAPAVGALLLVRIGPDALFLFDAGTFLAAAVLIRTLQGVRGQPDLSIRFAVAPVGEGMSVRSRVLREAFRLPALRELTAANFANGFAVTVAQALLVVAARQRLGSDTDVGYLYATVGVGGTVGGLLALRWAPARPWIRVSALLVVTVELVALAVFSESSNVAIVFVVLAVSAGSSSLLDVWGTTEIQRLAPDHLISRLTSVIYSALYSGMLLGAGLALGTADILGWSSAVELACAVGLATVLVAWLWRPAAPASRSGPTKHSA